MQRESFVRLLDEGEALLDVLLELGEGSVDELLLLGDDVTEVVDLLDTVGAKLHSTREELNSLGSKERTLNKSRRNNPRLALQSPQQQVRELRRRIRHTQRRGPRAILRLHNLITSILNPMHKRLPRLAALLHGRTSGRLRKQGDDRDTRVAANDGNRSLSGVGARDAGKEAGRTDDVEGRDTEEARGVVRAGFFKGARDDGDGGVDGVGMTRMCASGAFRATAVARSRTIEALVCGHYGGESMRVCRDVGAYVEEVIARHLRAC